MNHPRISRYHFKGLPMQVRLSSDHHQPSERSLCQTNVNWTHLNDSPHSFSSQRTDCLGHFFSFCEDSSGVAFDDVIYQSGSQRLLRRESVSLERDFTVHSRVSDFGA